MCDNGFNSLGSPNIFRELRYRVWMHEVWESYKFYVQKMKQDELTRLAVSRILSSPLVRVFTVRG